MQITPLSNCNNHVLEIKSIPNINTIHLKIIKDRRQYPPVKASNTTQRNMISVCFGGKVA